jgi:trigger factor
VRHQIEHLAEDSDRSPQQIAAVMRRNGTYQLLEEEMARAKAWTSSPRTPSPS